jgi:hypothetical protein
MTLLRAAAAMADMVILFDVLALWRIGALDFVKQWCALPPMR